MNTDDWEVEMNRMLDSFDREASSSLEKISARFEELGRPFDHEFRQHFLKMSNLRLDLSFTKIELKHWSKKRACVNEIQYDSAMLRQTASARSNEHEMNLQINNSNLANESNSFLVVEKNESHNDLIEIIDSDDENVSVQSDRQETIVQSAETTDGNESNTPVLEINGDGINDDDNTIKNEPDASVKFEIMDECLPTVTFDPNQNSDESDGERGDIVSAPQKLQSGKKRESRRPKEQIQNKMKRTAAKRFKCKQCKYSTNRSGNLKTHQKVHAHEKSMGVARDSNNLYHCTLCVRQFTNIGHLSLHMKSHKNNQYLYDCARCMRQFVRKADKDRHDGKCIGYFYECYLCQAYATNRKRHMEQHMRTHSGAKPFQCMVCDKSFQQKGDLRRHLNSIHGRL